MISWNNKIDCWKNYYNHIVFMVPKEFYTNKMDYGENARLIYYLVSRVEVATEVIKQENDSGLLFTRLTTLLERLIENCGKRITLCELLIQFKHDYQYTEEEIINGVKELYKLRVLGLADELMEVEPFVDMLRKEYKATPLCMEVLFSYIYKKMGVPYMFAPSKFTFVITNKCNAKCSTCYRGKIKAEPTLQYKEELTTKDVFNVIEQLHKIGTDRLKFLGGEPFCRKDIFEIIGYAHRHNMITEISTNGLALAEKDNINKLKALNRTLLNIQISIDGMENGQNKQRVGADFNTVVQAMDNMNNEGIRFSTNTIVSRTNMNEMDELIQFLSKYNVSSRFQIMKACGVAKENLENILTPLEKKQIIGIIDSAAKKYCANVRNSIIFHPFASKSKKETDYKAVYHRCRSCTYGMALNPEGYVLPCEFLEPFPIFRCENVKNKSVLDIWHESVVFKKLRYVKVEGRCSKCEYSAICEMGCFAETMGLTNSIAASDPVCWYEPKSGKVSFPETNEYILMNYEGEMI